MTDQNQHVCPWWFAYTFDNPFRNIFHKPERLFADWVQPGMTVADIGCGMGYFSLGLARMVQDKGKVIAVDLQPQMIARTSARASKARLAGIIETRLCDRGSLGLQEPLDFVLAFWMVHETPDPADFFRQVKSALKPGGAILVAEPKFHVSSRQYHSMLAKAKSAGLAAAGTPSIAFSRSALLRAT